MRSEASGDRKTGHPIQIPPFRPQGRIHLKESIVHRRHLAPLATALMLLSGCAATIQQDGLEQRTAQAIGRPAGQFVITERSEETGGRINYTVNTRDGAVYRCYLYGATGFQTVMSFGQIPHSDAICTAMTGAKGASGAQSPSTAAPGGRGAGDACNALLRAAGRC